ncbi:hypothetical protein TNCV_1980591 [Trichonephila clavipes]|nr:hypothetical protein TNCV_1980591 [Trichonephila clavipes]
MPILEGSHGPSRILNGKEVVPTYKYPWIVKKTYLKDFSRTYSLCMIVGSSDQARILSKEDRVPGGHEALLRRNVAHRTTSTAEIRAVVGTTVTERTFRNRLFQGFLELGTQ